MSARPLKQWSITAIARESGLAFAKDGHEFAPLMEPSAPLSPVEYLLVAVSGCFALSIKAAITQRNRPFSWARVLVVGDKAAEPPSRLQSIELSVTLGAPLAASEIAAVLADAKRQCTVTNTLAAAPAIDIKLVPASRPPS
jgi:uncharacterized OsmC-like protein